jgi:UDP-4-amino-4,6-dideoxy-N-acetyl-beta-L-altrosamine N-acetyltransferase
MIIKGKNIILRPFKQEDAKKTLAWRCDPETRFLAMLHPYPVTEEMEQEWLQNILRNTSNKNVAFAIEIVADHKLIGYFQLRDIQWIHRRAWLGIIIGDKENRGKGLGEEAMNLGLDYAFNALNLQKICLEVLDVNKSAVKLYEKLGFEKEGLLKKHFYSNGKYSDVLIMSLIK